MLTLVGLGIWDERDLSLKGLEAAKRADIAYAEFYTANWGGSLKKLEKLIGRKITVLERSDLEEDVGRILEDAKGRSIAILVPGDPLVATTHVHIILEARKRKIPVRVIHSSSACTAVAESGLGIYGFGRTATVVKPQKGYEPSSFYDVIGTNKKNGLHTLLLLDIGMDVKEGIDLLMKIEKEKEDKLVTPETEIIAASRIGSGKQKIVFGKVKDIMKKKLEAPAVIIVPGKLHFLEKEFLKGF